MEAELDAIALTLKELAEWQAQLVARLDEISARLNEMQEEIAAVLFGNRQ